MLGIAPDDTGRIPDSDAKRLQEFGTALHRIYSHNLAAESGTIAGDPTAAAAVDNDLSTFWSAPFRHATLEVNFSKPVTFDRAVTMEWLNEGQHIQEYAIEAWQNGAWKPLVHAQAIGHKKIDLFPPITAQRVRLNLISITGSAAIREFQLYDGSSTK
jgi:alpha-L-fucosidase